MYFWIVCCTCNVSWLGNKEQALPSKTVFWDIFWFSTCKGIFFLVLDTENTYLPLYLTDLTRFQNKLAGNLNLSNTVGDMYFLYSILRKICLYVAKTKLDLKAGFLCEFTTVVLLVDSYIQCLYMYPFKINDFGSLLPIF